MRFAPGDEIAVQCGSMTVRTTFVKYDKTLWGLRCYVRFRSGKIRGRYICDVKKVSLLQLIAEAAAD